MVAATIRKMHAPNHEAAVLLVSGSPDENLPYTFTPPISPTTAPMAYISLVPGVEIRTHHRGGFVDARDAVSLCESGGGCGDDKCRGEDCFSVFQDVLVHKLFLFFAVKRVDGPLSGG